MNMMGSPWQRLSQLSPEEMQMLQAMVGQDGPPMDPAMYDQMKNEVAGARPPPGQMQPPMGGQPPPMAAGPPPQEMPMAGPPPGMGAPPPEQPPMGPMDAYGQSVIDAASQPGATQMGVVGAGLGGAKDAMLAKIMAMIGG